MISGKLHYFLGLLKKIGIASEYLHLPQHAISW